MNPGSSNQNNNANNVSGNCASQNNVPKDNSDYFAKRQKNNEQSRKSRLKKKEQEKELSLMREHLERTYVQLHRQISGRLQNTFEQDSSSSQKEHCERKNV